MTCRELDQFLHPYLDGEFDAGEAIALEEHVGGCPACARQVDEERALRAKVRSSLASVTTPASERLRQNIQRGLAREDRRSGTFPWMRTGAWAAAMAATLAGSFFYFRDDPHRRFVEEAAARHARGLPFEIQTPSHEGVEAWFGGKLLHRVAVPRLANAVVAGARLSNVTDKEAAYISYETAFPQNGHAPRRIGLFVFHDVDQRVKARPLPAVQMANTQGYNVALWRDGEIVYELVSDLDENDIRHLLRNGTQGASRAPPMTAPTPGMEVQPASFQQ